MRLNNKIAFITGAASGIGRAEAILFAREGASVAVADFNLAGAENVAGEIVAAGGKAIALGVDIADESAVDEAVARTIGHFGRIDILGLTAGKYDDGRPTLETSDELWDQVFAVNVKGNFYVANAALPQMIKRGSGAIVIVSANSGLLGGGGGASYTASKHASIGYGRHLAATYGRHGIRTNMIAPGVVATPMSEKDRANPWVIEFIGRLPTPRAAEPEEIAELALFLASDAASYMQAATISIDGGMIDTIW